MKGSDLLGAAAILSPLLLAGLLVGLGLMGGALSPSRRRDAERGLLIAASILTPAAMAWLAYGAWRSRDLRDGLEVLAIAIFWGAWLLPRLRRTKSDGRGAQA